MSTPRTPSSWDFQEKWILEVWRQPSDRKATAGPGRASTPKTGDPEWTEAECRQRRDPAFCPWNSPWGRLEASSRSAHSGPLCPWPLHCCLLFPKRASASLLPPPVSCKWRWRSLIKWSSPVSSFILLSTPYISHGLLTLLFACLLASYLHPDPTPVKFLLYRAQEFCVSCSLLYLEQLAQLLKYPRSTHSTMFLEEVKTESHLFTQWFQVFHYG